MIVEFFANQQNTNLAVQAIPGTGVTAITIIDVFMFTTNLGPQRTGRILLDVDGNGYVLDFTLTEEAIDQRSVQGYAKQENPDTVET